MSADKPLSQFHINVTISHKGKSRAVQQLQGSRERLSLMQDGRQYSSL